MSAYMDAQQARAEGILADFAAEMNATPAPTTRSLRDLYVDLGCAAAACIAGGWTPAQTDALEAAYVALQRAQGTP